METQQPEIENVQENSQNIKDFAYNVAVDAICLSLKTATNEHLTKVRELVYENALIAVRDGLKPFVKRELETNVVQSAEFEENKAHQPFLILLKDGVSLFKEKHPEVPIIYTPALWYVSCRDVVDSLSEPFSVNDVNFVKQVFDLDDADTKIDAMYKDKTVLEAIMLMVKNGESSSLMQSIFLRHLPNEVQATITNAIADAQADTSMEAYLESVVPSIRRKVETFVAENGVPVSNSELIGYCLEETNGNISQALDALTAFFKYGARYHGSDYVADGSSRNELVDRVSNEKANWMREHILDEYSFFIPFNFLPAEEAPYVGNKDALFNAASNKLFPQSKEKRVKINYDYSRRSKVGLPYHAAHMVSLLKELPPELITFAMLGEYVHSGEVHGLSKFLSDISLSSELYKINHYLESFAH